MKIKIYFNGSPADRDIPVTWGQVTFKQFLDVVNLKDKDGQIDTGQALAYFLGIEYMTMRAMRFVNYEQIVLALGFLNGKMNVELPAKCMGYDVPKDLEYQAAGQYDDLKSIVNQMSETEPEKTLEKYPLIVATYACSQAYARPYDYNDAEKLAPFFMDAPCGEVLAIGNFTVMKLTALKMGTENPYLMPLTLRNRFRRGWITFRNILVSIPRYFIWRSRQVLRGMN